MYQAENWSYVIVYKLSSNVCGVAPAISWPIFACSKTIRDIDWGDYVYAVSVVSMIYSRTWGMGDSGSARRGVIRKTIKHGSRAIAHYPTHYLSAQLIIANAQSDIVGAVSSLMEIIAR